MQENQNIVTIPFTKLDKKIVPGNTREERRNFKKVPLLVHGGKIYINSSLSCKGLLFTYFNVFTKTDTDKLREKLKLAKEKYPWVHEPTQIPKIRDLRERAEAAYIFLIPYELQRRVQFVDSLIDQ